MRDKLNFAFLATAGKLVSLYADNIFNLVVVLLVMYTINIGFWCGISRVENWR